MNVYAIIEGNDYEGGYTTHIYLSRERAREQVSYIIDHHSKSQIDGYAIHLADEEYREILNRNFDNADERESYFASHCQIYLNRYIETETDKWVSGDNYILIEERDAK